MGWVRRGIILQAGKILPRDWAISEGNIVLSRKNIAPSVNSSV